MKAATSSSLAGQLASSLADLLRDWADRRPVDLRGTIEKQGLPGEQWIWEAATMCLAATRIALRTDQQYADQAVQVTTLVLDRIRSEITSPAVRNALSSYVAARLPAYLGCFEYTLTHGTPEAVRRAVAKAADQGTETLAFVDAVGNILREHRSELLAAGFKNGDAGHETTSLFALARDPFDALQLWNTTFLTFRYVKDVIADPPYHTETRQCPTTSARIGLRLTRDADPVAIKQYEHIRPAPTWGPVRCFARLPEAMRTCTLAKGHEGPHVAHTFFKKVVAVWED